MGQFLSVIEDIPVHEALERIKKDTPVEKKESTKVETKPVRAFPYTQEHIDQRILALMNDQTARTELLRATKWTDESLKRFEIGYDRATQRYWIPIKEGNRLVNIRRYSITGDPKILNVTNFGEARLFPFENLENREIVIMEGEKDCILANQFGFNAVAVTGGAGTFKSHWKQYFTDKDVVICYDIDTPGIDGAKKVADNLTHVARSLKIIKLPITEPANGDFTDWVSHGATPVDFRALIDSTERLEAEHEGPIKILEDVHDTTLDKLADQKMFYKRVKLDVRVISKDSSPSIIPKVITVSCNHDAPPKTCANCSVGDKGNTDSVTIDETMPEILQLIECTTKERKSIIRDIFRIPACKKFKIHEIDHQAITRCSIIPSIDDIKFDQKTHNQKYVERELFFLEKNLEANTDYEIHAIAMPDPKDQSLVHLGYKVKPSDSSIEEFKMTDELKKELEIFQCPLENK
jgi:hypothetical protein